MCVCVLTQLLILNTVFWAAVVTMSQAVACVMSQALDENVTHVHHQVHMYSCIRPDTPFYILIYIS